MSLTNLQVKQAKAKEKAYKLADTIRDVPVYHSQRPKILAHGLPLWR